MRWIIVLSLAGVPLSAKGDVLGQESGEATKTAGADYNITLVTDSAPDFTDLPSYLRSITSQYETPQDKAIGIWRWSQRLAKADGLRLGRGNPSD